MRSSASRLSTARFILIGAAILGTTGAQAAGAALSTQAVGVWDLKLDNGSHECRLMLREDEVPPGYALGMPPGCHSAFPFLANVRMWIDVGEGKLQFEDAKGEPLLVFEPGADGSLSATGPGGEALRLVSVGRHPDTVLRGSGPSIRISAVRSQAVKLASPASTVSTAALPRPAAPKLPLPSVEEMAGHYSVLRKFGKDTGCMVTFDDKARGPAGSFKANLAPACRDQGIMIFDPVGWQLQAGRLVLTARKGHTTALDLQSDGSWAKDAKEGVGMSLKKM